MKLEMLFLLLVLGIIGARGNSGSTNDQAPVPAVHDDLEEAPVEGVNGSTNSPVEHTEVVHEGDHGNTTHTGKHHVERYHVAVFDFENVAAPFLISLWIVLASAAKMGEFFFSKMMFLLVFLISQSEKMSIDTLMPSEVTVFLVLPTHVLQDIVKFRL